jgi:predicted 3-demethylubiquinone-9 3-methyltransferase (glyoxalase superfamily)
MQNITPFLWFDRNAEEAMNFYVDIFAAAPGEKKGESKINSIKRYPEGITEGPMAGFEGKVLTAVFQLNGDKFMCLDGGPVFKANGAVSFLVQCENQEEIDHYWDRLTEGGDPNAQQCGWLQDKYGFSWQIVPDMGRWLDSPNPESNKRAMNAMLQMKKIVIADLEKAAE